MLVEHCFSANFQDLRTLEPNKFAAVSGVKNETNKVYLWVQTQLSCKPVGLGQMSRMTTRRSKLKRKKMMKYAEIALAVLLIAVVIAAAVIYYNPSTPSEPPKLKAVDFFVFTDLGAEAESIANSSTVLKLQKLYLTVIPIGGNATEFHIDPGGNTDPTEFYEPRIDNGTSHVIEATLTAGVQSTRNGSTYPVKIFVYCAEAEGYVTLQIPEENVLIY